MNESESCNEYIWIRFFGYKTIDCFRHEFSVRIVCKFNCLMDWVFGYCKISSYVIELISSRRHAISFICRLLCWFRYNALSGFTFTNLCFVFSILNLIFDFGKRVSISNSGQFRFQIWIHVWWFYGHIKVICSGRNG